MAALGYVVWCRQSVKLSTVGGRSFPVAGPTVCNSLPDNVISAPSLSTFRQRFCPGPRSLTLGQTRPPVRFWPLVDQFECTPPRQIRAASHGVPIASPIPDHIP